MEPVTVGASEFKAKCLSLLDEVAKDGRTLVITKRGKPVARVTPVSPPKSLKGSWKGLVKITGDIVHTDMSGEWETLREWDELNK